MMRPLYAGLCALVLIASAAVATTRSQTGQGQPATRADLERWKKELSNWGRWGAGDEQGALNLITPAKRRQAASLVRDGVLVSLSRDGIFEKDVDTDIGIPGTGVYERTMAVPGLDYYLLRYHGFAHTHLDALAHVTDGGRAYNGYVAEKDKVMSEGLARSSIYVARHGIVTRGVLMDIPRLRGVPYLELDDRITPADLEAWEKKAGVKVSAGDALLVRTGRWARRAKVGPWNAVKQAAGLDASVIPWLRQRDVAILGGELPQDAVPPRGDMPGLAVHNFALVYLGVHLLDNVALDELAEAAAARKRWEFQLTIAPLRMPTGTGSPVNPIAVF
jgi:kynurenine formamidase